MSTSRSLSRSRKTLAAASLSAAALTLGLVGPADAASIAVSDPSDTSHGSDLRSVRVHNNDHSVVVVTRHVNLRRDPASGSGGQVYIDTDRSDRGPEYVFVGGYFEGTDYALVRTEGFGHRKWKGHVLAPHRMTIDYARETVRMWMSRKALGHPGKVRVAVRVSGTRTDGTSTGLVDWLGDPHSFTRWIARG